MREAAVHVRPYPKYKPSGVEWLGEVPEHWEVKRLKYSASINDQALPEDTDPNFEMSYVDISSVDAVQGIVAVEDMVFEDAPSRARRVVCDGDTIISTVRTYLRAISPVRNPSPNTIVSTGFAVVRPRRVAPPFMSYALREPGFVEAIVARSVGVSYPAVNASEIGTLPIPLPDEDGQRAIADFLDRETEKIDTLVAKKRTLIERLKEKRSALITRTVTRGLPPDAARAAGLDPHPKLKLSGIDWLGEVPEHWEVKRLKFVLPRLESGVSVNAEKVPADDDSAGVLKTSCVYGNRFRPEENKRVIDADLDRVACPVTCDSVIVSRMNTPGLVGSCGYVSNDYPNLFLPDRLWIARFSRAHRSSGKYAWYLLTSHALIDLTGALATGTSGSMKNLSQDEFLGIDVAVPLIDEQRAIADFLDGETARIDGMIAKVDTAIERLQEYRTALITAAVTGKIDVRGTTAA